MTVATTRYGYQKGAWDAPLSFGVQALIDFNGYTINDRHQADRIRVYSITGLDGSDVTDVREAIPGDDGEFAYPGLYRGRTLVITGAIQAGSLATCMQMGRDLRAAYAPLVESEMKFRWFDIFDGFDDVLTLQNYTPVIGSASPLSVSGGLLYWGTTSKVILMRSADNRLWGDVQQTIRAIVGDVGVSSSVILVMSLSDVNNYLSCKLFQSGSTVQIHVDVHVNGTVVTLSSTTVPALQQGQPVWLRGKREGDLVTTELWMSSPQNNAFPDFTTSAWLSGQSADLLGDTILSQVGFGAQTQASTNWALDDYQVESLTPCDVAFNVKSITKPSIQDAQQKRTIFERPFQLTLRASKPFARCATQSRSQTLRPSEGGTTTLGFGFPLRLPLSFTDIISGTVSLENNILFVNNRGKAPERPILSVFGAIEDFAIFNLTNGLQVTWTGSLADGDYLVFDCASRTLVDSSGSSQKQHLQISDPRWMILEPGWNDLFITGSGYSANTSLTAFWHHRYV